MPDIDFAVLALFRPRWTKDGCNSMYRGCLRSHLGGEGVWILMVSCGVDLNRPRHWRPLAKLETWASPETTATCLRSYNLTLRTIQAPERLA